MPTKAATQTHPSGLDKAARDHILATVEEFQSRQLRNMTLDEHLREVYGDVEEAAPESETSEA